MTRLVLAVAVCASMLAPRFAHALNAIVAENALPGSPPGDWDVTGAGDPSIQGFATDISVNRGETISFKIATDATAYRLDIYRLGYYGGLGARRVATLTPSAALPQSQPACLSDPSTGLVDCGNWAVSASWAVPPTATSGIYLAKLVREDPEDGRASHIAFVVRDDAGGSDVLVQTSDTTWQAYNTYGGNSLHRGAGRAGVQGELQPAVHDPVLRVSGGLGAELAVRCRVPDGALARAQRLRRELHDGGRHRSAGRGAARAPGVRVGGARRVLVGGAAGERRGGACRRRASGVLQRQRGLLEDALGAEHRRLGDRSSHAGLVSRDAGRREDRPAARRLDRHVARSALRPARRRPSRERPQRHRVHGERGGVRRHGGAGRGRQDASLAQHERRHARRRRRRRAAHGGFGLRVGRGPGQRCPPVRARAAVDDHGVGRAHSRGLRLIVRLGSRHASPDALPARQRRARLRRGHRAVVVGSRRPARLPGHADGCAHAAGDGQPARRHGRAAADAPGRSRPGVGLERRHRADHGARGAAERDDRRERDVRHRRRNGG